MCDQRVTPSHSLSLLEVLRNASRKKGSVLWMLSPSTVLCTVPVLHAQVYCHTAAYCAAVKDKVYSLRPHQALPSSRALFFNFIILLSQNTIHHYRNCCSVFFCVFPPYACKILLEFLFLPTCTTCPCPCHPSSGLF